MKYKTGNLKLISNKSFQARICTIQCPMIQVDQFKQIYLMTAFFTIRHKYVPKMYEKNTALKQIKKNGKSIKTNKNKHYLSTKQVKNTEQ